MSVSRQRRKRSREKEGEKEGEKKKKKKKQGRKQIRKQRKRREQRKRKHLGIEEINSYDRQRDSKLLCSDSILFCSDSIQDLFYSEDLSVSSEISAASKYCKPANAHNSSSEPLAPLTPTAPRMLCSIFPVAAFFVFLSSRTPPGNGAIPPLPASVTMLFIWHILD
jgi:hypothetical protein